MGFPSPLGLLGRLPQEIRDEIYRNVLCSRYKLATPDISPEPFPPGAYVLRTTASLPGASVSTNMDILRTSKSIALEAASILYNQSVFRFELAFPVPKSNIRLPSSTTANYSRIKNLEINIDANELGRHGLSLFEITPEVDRVIDMRYEASIEQFLGVQTLRNTIRIQFNKCESEAANVSHNSLDQFSRVLLPATLQKSTTQLLGFEKVIIELCCRESSIISSVILSTLPSTATIVIGHNPTDVQAQYDGYMNAIGASLKQSLGPYTLHDLEDKRTKYARYIIFHPRKYLAAQSMKV